MSHTLRDNDFDLTWTTTNAEYAVIDNSIGEVELNGTDTVSISSVPGMVNYNSVTYTITAYGRGGTTATASTTIVRTPPTTNANIVCIAVIDENDSNSLASMTTKWAQFRTNWPNKKFYLLQPGNWGPLNVPIDFLEKTDPDTYNGTR